MTDKQLGQYYDQISIEISENIKKIDQKDRLNILKELNPTDLSLMNLFLQALKKEYYEVCDVSKTLLLERGYEIPS